MAVQVAETALPPAVGQVRKWPGAGLVSGWRGVAVVSFLATVLSWRPYPWHPVYAGIDPSWEVGLAMGFTRHLQWGPSVIFTFGPFGFVDGIYPFYRLTAALSILYALAVVWGLAALVVSALRPSWGLLGAGVAAWAALALAASRTGYSDVAAGTALGLALAVLVARQDRARLGLIVVLGALAGFQLMVKTNEGLLTLGLLVVVVVFGNLDWRRAVPAAGAAAGRCLFRRLAGCGAKPQQYRQLLARFTFGGRRVQLGHAGFERAERRRLVRRTGVRVDHPALQPVGAGKTGALQSGRVVAPGRLALGRAQGGVRAP